MRNQSKPLSKPDDSAAEFLIKSLGGDPGRCFDIETIFYTECADPDSGLTIPRWVLFEFLKCDSYPVDRSHPNRYMDKNKRKFLSLWGLRQSLHRHGMLASLYLINYSGKYDIIKKMHVMAVTEDEVETTDELMTFEEWKTMFRKLNKEKKADTWNVLDWLNREEDK